MVMVTVTAHDVVNDCPHRFEYEVNEHGHVVEVVIDRRTGRRCSESMVYGLTGDGEPYTKWHGERYYLPEEDAERAREAREAYLAWSRGYGSDPRWAWEEVDL